MLISQKKKSSRRLGGDGQVKSTHDSSALYTASDLLNVPDKVSTFVRRMTHGAQNVGGKARLE
jgi:hypothetical protein